jgi:hypothetical protein
MQELALVPLVTASHVRSMSSALPDSPVVAQRPPGRARLAAAAALHRLATHLDPSSVPQPQPHYRARPLT